MIVEQLPSPEEAMLVSGTPRGTQYRPQLVEAPVVHAPEGATTTIEVTIDAGACVGTWDKRSPSVAGAHLPTGSIQIDKEISGPAAAYAPEEILADVECTISGVDVHMGDFGTVSLSEDGGWIVRVDGFPLGSAGTVSEQGETGEFGETSRTGSPTDLQVESVVGADDQRVVLGPDNDYVATVGDLPQGAACVVAETLNGGADASSISPEDGTVVIGEGDEVAEVVITNTFEATSLVVTKAVEGPAPQGSTFEVDLQCVRVVDGAEQEVTIPGGSTRELTLDNLSAVYDDLPLGATCVVTETGTGGADDTSVAVTGADGAPLALIAALLIGIGATAVLVHGR
ncbi:DUF5979 domain-containing protein [Georgenia sp. Z1491]|uniref:DUF5979 domain-containing protein n=1 Tax=Georgenia sp. Z1491 TaxID=3416707 RepID=UPI003CED907F